MLILVRRHSLLRPVQTEYASNHRYLDLHAVICCGVSLMYIFIIVLFSGIESWYTNISSFVSFHVDHTYSIIMGGTIIINAANGSLAIPAARHLLTKYTTISLLCSLFATLQRMMSTQRSSAAHLPNPLMLKLLSTSLTSPIFPPYTTSLTPSPPISLPANFPLSLPSSATPIARI